MTILSPAQVNPFMVGYLSTGNNNNFVHVKEASLWSSERQLYLSLLYTLKENCFDKLPIHYQDTICYVDPTSRQMYSFARQFTCVGNPAKIIA